MPEYRRRLVPGSCYFFTVTLADRSSDRLVRDIAALRSAVASTQARHAFVIDAWVVLPDHLHAVWTLPEGDCDRFDALGIDQASVLLASAGQ